MSLGNLHKLSWKNYGAIWNSGEKTKMCMNTASTTKAREDGTLSVELTEHQCHVRLYVRSHFQILSIQFSKADCNMAIGRSEAISNDGLQKFKVEFVLSFQTRRTERRRKTIALIVALIDKCHRSYKYQSNLCNQKREECGKDPSYFCPVCNRGFKKKQQMQRHVAGIRYMPAQLQGSHVSQNAFKVPQHVKTNIPISNTSDSMEAQSFDNQKSEASRNVAITATTSQLMPQHYSSNPLAEAQSITLNNMDFLLQQVNDSEINQQMKEMFLNKMYGSSQLY